MQSMLHLKNKNKCLPLRSYSTRPLPWKRHVMPPNMMSGLGKRADALSAAERSAQERSARERVTMGLMGTVIAPETDKAI
ncbi:hypothetical protein PC116_g18407 [Phytophthora cactorum]|nr:hypothetical protein PC111_g13216 [Phytophthora cactorum]KAG4233389.1 hypothetical protein PC116_g18407 [Phytophthora cactorum]